NGPHSCSRAQIQPPRAEHKPATVERELIGSERRRGCANDLIVWRHEHLPPAVPRHATAGYHSLYRIAGLVELILGLVVGTMLDPETVIAHSRVTEAHDPPVRYPGAI